MIPNPPLLDPLPSTIVHADVRGRYIRCSDIYKRKIVISGAAFNEALPDTVRSCSAERKEKVIWAPNDAGKGDWNAQFSMRRNCWEATIPKTDTEERDRTAFPITAWVQNLIFEALRPTLRGMACLINLVNRNESALDVNQSFRYSGSTSLRVRWPSKASNWTAIWVRATQQSTSQNGSGWRSGRWCFG